MLLPGAAELNKKMFSKENKYKKAGKAKNIFIKMIYNNFFENLYSKKKK